MRTMRRSIPLGICALLLLLGGCHADTNFTQTFVNQSDPHQSLKLTSKVGFIRPAAESYRNVLFRLFGTDELSGTYVLSTGEETVEGTFVAGKDETEQWIKFTSEGRKDWSLKVQAGGLLVGTDDTVWRLKESFTNAKAATRIKIGG